MRGFFDGGIRRCATGANLVRSGPDPLAGDPRLRADVRDTAPGDPTRRSAELPTNGRALGLFRNADPLALEQMASRRAPVSL